MKRRDTIKTLLVGTLAGGAAGTTLQSCEAEPMAEQVVSLGIGRTPFERERDKKLLNAQFFTDSEFDVLARLCDIILPATDTAGSATDAEVPAFINFMCNDVESIQTPLRGGIAWINNEALTRFGKGFADISDAQQLEIVDDIAYPGKEPEGMTAGVNFFNRMRDMTMTGYYTSKIGIKDLGYVGNIPNVWDGVPQDVLDKHGMSYDPEWLAKCVDQSKRNDIAEWDDEGNLLT
jgi:hypothetical protein